MSGFSASTATPMSNTHITLAANKSVMVDTSTLMEQDFFVFMTIYSPNWQSIPASVQVCGGETITASIDASFIFDIGTGTQEIADLSTVFTSSSVGCIVDQYEIFASSDLNPYTGNVHVDSATKKLLIHTTTA